MEKKHPWTIILFPALTVLIAANDIISVKYFGVKGDGRHIAPPAVNAAPAEATGWLYTIFYDPLLYYVPFLACVSFFYFTFAELVRTSKTPIPA